MKTSASTTGILAWHFVGDHLRDGRPVPPDGETLRHDGPLRMCRSGLHASTLAIDALKYAPGPIACRVCCAGEIEYDDNKLVCSERTILWRVNTSEVLRSFAQQCALDVAHLWDMPTVVRQYLETGDETLIDRVAEAANDAAYTASDYHAASTAYTAAYAAAYAASDGVYASHRAHASCAAAYASAYALYTTYPAAYAVAYIAYAALYAAYTTVYTAATKTVALAAGKTAQNERLTKMLIAAGHAP